MFSKTFAILALFATGALAVSPCTPEHLDLHGIASKQKTAPYSRWESLADTDGKHYHIFDQKDSTEPLCVFESSLVPSLNRRSFVPRGGSLALSGREQPACFNDVCANAAQCIAEGCSQGCSTWWTPGWPGNPGGLNTACIG